MDKIAGENVYMDSYYGVDRLLPFGYRFFTDKERTEQDWHSHKTIEIGFTMRGNGYEIAYEDNVYHTEVNDIFVMNSNEKHCAKSLDDDQRMLFVLMFPLEWIKFMSPEYANQKEIYLRGKNSISFDQIEYYDKLVELLKRFIMYAKVQKKVSQNRHYILNGIVLEILYYIFEYFTIENQTIIETSEEALFQISDTLDYIHENYRSNLTVDDLANRAHFSKNYFTKLFRETMQISPMKYLTEVRLQHAVSIMQTVNWSTEEISKQVGFKNYRSFSRAFKEKYHLSPNQYKAKLKK